MDNFEEEGQGGDDLSLAEEDDDYDGGVTESRKSLRGILNLINTRLQPDPQLYQMVSNRTQLMYVHPVTLHSFL